MAESSTEAEIIANAAGHKKIREVQNFLRSIKWRKKVKKPLLIFDSEPMLKYLKAASITQRTKHMISTSVI